MCFALPLLWIAALAADDPPAFEPTDRYEARTIEGWPVLVNRGLLDEPDLAGPTLELLRVQLYQVTRMVPAPALATAARVTIWVEARRAAPPVHGLPPDAGWLKDHGMNPAKGRCVEIANARQFLDWSKEQPWMVLHELAHAYHHQVLDGGYDNAEVRAAHGRRRPRDSTATCSTSTAGRAGHYGATNPMEFFAEASEAYFGTNDFYPFVRSELQRHDPATFDLIARLSASP